jgi:hypothetical protein
MPIFNFHKMTNMQKGYAYQFSDFITYQKKNTRINVCVLCAHNVHSKKAAVVCCKVANTWLCSRFCKPYKFLTPKPYTT